MDDNSFSRDLLLSLPPMETREWNMTKSDLNKLNIYSDDVMKERNQKLCVVAEHNRSSSSSSLSSALRIALNEHHAQYKDKGTVTARYNVQEEGGEKVMIRTCAEHLASHNCCSGNWTAEWTLLPNKNSTEGEISGKIGLHVYYYEDGSNVQLRANRDFDCVNVSGGDDKGFAKAAVEQIAKWEGEVYGELSSLFDDGEMESKLRQIRRILPITKTRFKWDAAAQASVKLLNARSK